MTQEKSIIQFEFWNECKESRCKFCSLAYTANDDNTCDPERIRSAGEKKNIIERLTNYLNGLDWDKFDQISFQGGEIMNSYEPEYLPAYTALLGDLMRYMIEGKLKKLYLITSLKFKYECSLLDVTLSMFQDAGLADRVMVGTSYDLKYRFTKENHITWWENLGKVKRAGFRLHCTTVLSQFLIEAYMADDIRIRRILKIFPGRLLDLIGTIGDRHNKMMPKDFLPTRKSFFDFCFFLMRTNYPLWRRFADQSGRRATHVYRPLHDSVIWRDIKNHTSNDKDLLAECGHFVYCRSYADSDECYACDVLKMLDLEQGAMQ